VLERGCSVSRLSVLCRSASCWGALVLLRLGFIRSVTCVPCSFTLDVYTASCHSCMGRGCSVVGFLYSHGWMLAVIDRMCATRSESCTRCIARSVLLYGLVVSVGLCRYLYTVIPYMHSLFYTPVHSYSCYIYGITHVWAPSSWPYVALFVGLVVPVGLAVGLPASHFECFARCHSDDLRVPVKPSLMDLSLYLCLCSSCSLRPSVSW